MWKVRVRHFCKGNYERCPKILRVASAEHEMIISCALIVRSAAKTWRIVGNWLNSYHALESPLQIGLKLDFTRPRDWCLANYVVLCCFVDTKHHKGFVLMFTPGWTKTNLTSPAHGFQKKPLLDLRSTYTMSRFQIWEDLEFERKDIYKSDRNDYYKGCIYLKFPLSFPLFFPLSLSILVEARILFWKVKIL